MSSTSAGLLFPAVGDDDGKVKLENPECLRVSPGERGFTPTFTNVSDKPWKGRLRLVSVADAQNRVSVFSFSEGRITWDIPETQPGETVSVDVLVRQIQERRVS